MAEILDPSTQLTTILEGLGQPFYAVDSEWRITLYNSDAARHFGRPAADMMGHSISDAFPEDRAEERGRVLHEAMARRQPAWGEIQSMTGRWVSYSMFPLGDGLGVLLRDITDRKNAELQREQARETLRKRTAELEAVLQTMPTAVWYTSDLQARSVFANRRAVELLRLPSSASAGGPFTVYCGDQSIPADGMPLHRAVRGETVNDEVLDVLFDSGDRRTMLWRAAPLRGEDGAIQGAVCAAADVTERHRYEDHLKFLMNELNHRVKNTLAMVQSIASQTLLNVDPAAHAEFEQRLLTLSAVHGLLSDDKWAGARLHELIRATLRAHLGENSDRLSTQGEDLRIKPKTAVALSIALHELGTNALKYGALSTRPGSVAIRWSIDNERFHLCWEERGGPQVTPPTRRGFGSRMIEDGLVHELGGEVRLDYLSGGLVCTIDAPLESIRDV